MSAAVSITSVTDAASYDADHEIAEAWIAYETLGRAVEHHLRRLTRLEDRLVQILDGRDQAHAQIERAMRVQIEALKLIATIKDRHP